MNKNPAILESTPKFIPGDELVFEEGEDGSVKFCVMRDGRILINPLTAIENAKAYGTAIAKLMGFDISSIYTTRRGRGKTVRLFLR